MQVLKPPRIRKVSPRVMKEFEREAEIDRRHLLEEIEAMGGKKAFERQIESLKMLAAKNGGVYGPPKIHPKKLRMERYLEAEVPLRLLTGLSNALKVKEGLLLFPRGFAKAIVTVPSELREAFQLSAHSTSTFARCGVNVGIDNFDFARQLSKKKMEKNLKVMLENWSSVPVLLRTGDPCRLLNATELPKGHATLTSEPQTHALPEGFIHLHAGEHVLQIKRKELPVLKLPEGTVRYIDPHSPNLHELFSLEKFKQLNVKPGDFIVFPTIESIKLPNDTAAIVRTARDDLVHTTAVLLHPGSQGFQTLEFLAKRNATIKPGDHVATLHLHPVGKAAQFFSATLGQKNAAYGGRYQEQNSPKPKPRKK